MIIHTNIQNLSYAISKYKSAYGHDPYLFMNKFTMKLYGGIVDFNIIRNWAYDIRDEDAYSITLECDGCRVFEDNTLNILEVVLK